MSEKFTDNVVFVLQKLISCIRMKSLQKQKQQRQRPTTAKIMHGLHS